MAEHAFDRREVMKSLGLGALATLMPALRPGVARAATAPKRLVIFQTMAGTLMHPWRPLPAAGAAEATETAWELSDLHASLRPFKSKLLMLQGLSFPRGGGVHGVMDALSLTAFPGGMAPSIDQTIARAINAPAPVTALPSLELRVLGRRNDSPGGSEAVSRGVNNVPSRWTAPLPLEANPAQAFARLMKTGGLGAGMGTPSMGPSAAEVQRAKDKSVLDFVAKEFAAVKPRLSSRDRMRLELHAEAVAGLEKRLTLPAPSQPAPNFAGCKNVSNAWTSLQDDWMASSDAMMRLVQLALACDLTRVVTVSLGFPHEALWDYAESSQGWHNLHHCCASSKSGPELEAITRAHKLEADRFGLLLQLLDSVPDSDGRTVLDNTAVLWTNQFAGNGAGDHSLGNFRLIVAGGCGGAFRTGRYLRFGDYEQVSHSPSRALMGDLFLSLAHAMGVKLDKFGDTGMSTGPMSLG